MGLIGPIKEPGSHLLTPKGRFKNEDFCSSSRSVHKPKRKLLGGNRQIDGTWQGKRIQRCGVKP